jgi:hypothetical protein
MGLSRGAAASPDSRDAAVASEEEARRLEKSERRHE